MPDFTDYNYGVRLPVLPGYRGPYATAMGASAGLRCAVPRGRSVLFHGTRYPAKILREDALCCGESGHRVISFTRALHIAVHFALLERDDDEGRGAVLVLDRDKLRQSFCIDIRDEENPGDQRSNGGGEAEEALWYDVLWDLNRYLVGVIWVSPACVDTDNGERYRNVEEQLSFSECLLLGGVR